MKTHLEITGGAELKEQISRSSRRPAFPEIFRKNLTALRQHGKEQRNEDEERTRKKRREDQLKPGASLENSIPLGFNLHVFSSSSCSFFFSSSPPLCWSFRLPTPSSSIESSRKTTLRKTRPTITKRQTARVNK